jgi:hypothetical protein
MIFSIGVILFLVGTLQCKIFGEPISPLLGRMDINIHDIVGMLVGMVGFLLIVYSLLSVAWTHLP